MSYLVLWGDDVLYMPGDDSRALHGMSIHQNADGTSTMQFTMPPTHPLIESMNVRDMEHLIAVLYDDVLLFEGYISSITQKLSKELVIKCSDLLTWLDAVVIRYKPTDKRAGTALEELIAIYNNYASLTNINGGSPLSDYQFTVDPQCVATINIIGYADPDTNHDGWYIVDAETSSPESILQIIKRSILDDYGAFMRIRYENRFRYIGIFPSAPDENAQVIRFGENIVDYDYTETDEGMYNACFPVGGAVDEMHPSDAVVLSVAEASIAGSNEIMLKTSSGTLTVIPGDMFVAGLQAWTAVYGATITTTGTTVTLSVEIPYSVPIGTQVTYRNGAPFYKDGMLVLSRTNDRWVDTPQSEGSYNYYKRGDIVFHKSALENGIRCMTYQNDDIKDADEMLYKVVAILEHTRQPNVSLTIKAIDAAFYSSTAKHLKSGERVRVISEPHGVDMMMYVREASINLDDPTQTRYTLGTREKSITRMFGESQKDARATKSNIITELNNRIQTATIQELS